MGVQVSYRVDSKIQMKKAVCNHTRELRAGNPETGSLPRMQGAGRAYAHRGASEIFHCTGDGDIKGKSAVYVARKYGDRTKYFSGQHFWARGYFVSTVGRNEEAIRKYIQNQEAEDMKLDQNLGLFPEL